MKLKGVYTALITPFKGDRLNEEGLAANIRYQLEQGVDGIVPLGSTGEAATLSDAEREKVIAISVREAKGRVPVVVGIGDNDTARTIAKAARAQELGADAVLVVTPYYNRPTQEGIYRHVKAISETVSVPIVFYNVPGRTGTNLEPDTLARMAQLKTVVGLKESTGNLAQMSEMVRLTSGQKKPFPIFSGDDNLTLPLMSLGAVGVISVVSNLVPSWIVSLVRAIEENRWDEARAWHYKLWPLFKTAFIETNPAPIKEMMSHVGIAGGGVRLPLWELKPESRAKVHEVVEALEVPQPLFRSEEAVNPIRVGILGATGMVGQHYVQLLADHPWFEVTFLASSNRSAGQTYGDAVAGRWWLKSPPPEQESRLMVHPISDIDKARQSCQLVFSAVGSSVSAEWEEKYAAADLAVVSNSSYHRKTDDVPVVIPEINPDHLELIRSQRRARGWQRGLIVAKPNCTVQSYLIPLYPLHLKYRMCELIVTSLQAISGAGSPGPAASEMVDNVVPFVEGDEEKSQTEPLRILGRIADGAIKPEDNLKIAAQCNRVPVTDGHLACVSVKFEHRPTRDEILTAWRSYQGVPQQLDLPSAPKQPIIYLDEPDRPQPRRDRDAEAGMGVTVGRLRDCPVMHHRFVGLSHNVVRGAAGGAILTAELLVKYNFI